MPSHSADWGPGWVQPRTASAISPAAVEYARVLGQASPLFTISEPWGWQHHTLAVICDRLPDGRYRYRTVVVVICRQNGKTTLLFFVVADKLSQGRVILFTLHERQKARNKWLEVAVALSAAVPGRYHVSKRLGAEELVDTWTDGKFVLVTPDDAGGRSDTADDIIVDEAAHIKPAFLKAAKASLLTKPGAQTILISSGMTDKSEDMATARETAYGDLACPSGTASHGVIEWAAKTDPGIDGIDIYDEELWVECIPTLGLPGGVTYDAVRDMASDLPPEIFARELLSVPTGSPLLPPISASMWEACQIKRLPPLKSLRNVVLAVDTSPNQRQSSIAIAGMRGDVIYGAILSNARGDDWVLADTLAAARRARPMCIIIDAKSPAAQIAERAERRGQRPELTGPQYMAQSCAALFTSMAGPRIRVVADDAMTAAATGAIKRPIADTGWAWNRRDGSALDITPLVALSLAAHRADSYSR